MSGPWVGGGWTSLDCEDEDGWTSGHPDILAVGLESDSPRHFSVFLGASPLSHTL